MCDFIKKHLNWITAFGFSILNIILSLRYVGFVMFDQDPWIAMYGAKRILEGQLLYRNFFDFVTPGTDYLLAGIFYIFGLKLFVAQLAIILSNAVVIFLVVYLSFYIIKNRWLRLLPGLLFSLYSADVYYVSHHWFILLPVVLALFTGIKIVTFDATKSNKWFFPGLATAGAFLFIQSIGVTLFGMIVLFIIWYYTNHHFPINSYRINFNSNPESISYAQNDKANKDKSHGQLILLRSAMYYSFGFFIPIAFVIIVFALSDSLKAFIYDSFIWPFSHYMAINLSTPSDILRLWIKELSNNGFIMGIIYSFVVYFGILLSFMAFLYVIVKVKKNKTHELSLMAFVSFFCIGIVTGLLPNPPAFHLMVFMSIFMIAIIVIFEYSPIWSNRLIKSGFYIYFISITLIVSYNTYRLFMAYYRPENAVEAFRTPIGKIMMYKNFRDLPFDISYPYPFLKDPPVKLPRHIFVLYWSPSLYMLTGTNDPTPLNTYIPYYNTKEQTMSVIHALKADHTDLVVVDKSINFMKQRIGWLVHNRKVFSRNNPLINYIKMHYRLEKVIPGYKIYKLVK